MLVYDKTRLNKQFKESLKQERIAANMEFPNCKSKHNLLKINTNNMEKNFLPLIPIKITGIFKKAKDEHLIDSNIKKVKNNLEILSGMLSDGLISDGLINNNQNDKKIKIHINNNIKNIVLSNLILQDQSEKIFPQASKIGKFQKTIKIFE